MSIPLKWGKYTPKKEYSLKSGFFLWTLTQKVGVIYNTDDLGFVLVQGQKPAGKPMEPIARENLLLFIADHELDPTKVMLALAVAKPITKVTEKSLMELKLSLEGKR